MWLTLWSNDHKLLFSCIRNHNLLCFIIFSNADSVIIITIIYGCRPAHWYAYEINWNCKGHVTWATPSFGENYLCACSAFPVQSRTSNWKSLGSSSFEHMFDHMPKVVGVTWPRPHPLWGKIICAPARHFPYKAAYQSPNLKYLAQLVFEILRSKRIGVTSSTFQGHVTSSVTWPFDSPCAISYW